MADGEINNLLLIVIAFFLPPLAVFLKGGCTSHVCINIVLTCLFVLPGLIHAIWYVLKS